MDQTKDGDGGSKDHGGRRKLSVSSFIIYYDAREITYFVGRLMRSRPALVYHVLLLAGCDIASGSIKVGEK